MADDATDPAHAIDPAHATDLANATDPASATDLTSADSGAHDTVTTLRTRLTERRRNTWPATRRAGVLVPLIDDGGPLRLILTRRTDILRSHRGHVAFPGGGVEPGDDDIIATALREAEEEIGLPRDRVEVIGLLDDIPTVTGQQIVTPVVGRITSLPALVPDPIEVARIFEVPLDALRQPAGWIMRPHQGIDGRTWPVYYFAWDEETLWGLSAYVTLQLLALTPGGAPHALPDPFDR